MAVISPAHEYFARYDISQDIRRPGGYIPTYRFQGYAFLIRRHIFWKMGVFDAKLGQGYFEDTDLGRRLDLNGWHIGYILIHIFITKVMDRLDVVTHIVY